MTAYLTKRRMRIFGFTQFAKPLTDAIKANAEELAAANDLNIDYVRKKNFRKEDKVRRSCNSGEPARDWCGSSRPWSRYCTISPLQRSRCAQNGHCGHTCPSG